MKNTSLFRRILSVALVIALLGSFLVPTASAAETDKKVTSGTKELTLEPIDPGTLESQKQGVIPAEASKEEPDHRASDVVRVSIVLEKASTLDAGFRTENIAKNAAAVAYRESLRNDQKEMTAKIEKVIGGKLDVKWNLTLAANNISANVRYDQIDAIKAIDGVKDVFLENRYEPQVDNSEDEPNNGSASYMIGSNITWANGYTGAGSKVAVIDTGADIEHQSFSGEGLEYALAQNAEEKGLPYEDYIATLNLLTAEEIEAVKDQLNANIGSGEAAYRNTKVGYGYNYVDKDVSYITHIDDTQGEHGSHVSGISTANRFINVDGEFVPALQAVGTQGVAPDAQLVVMKVFGKGGGAYDSDYMVAIEDAIVLGCDSANLSLGSGSAGFSFSKGYEDIMNKLVENGTVVAFSAGNSYGWYDTVYNSAMLPYLYVDDINYATNGSPGSFTNALTVASVDNVGQTGMPLLFGDRHVFYSQTEGYGNEPISTIAGSEYQYVLVDGPGVVDNDQVGGVGDQFAALGSEVLTGKVAMCYRGSSSFFAKANAAVAQGAVAVIIINNTTGAINMNLSGYEYTAPAVSILKADGDAIKAASEPVTDEAGNVLYYTGSMSISDEMEVSVPDEITDTVTVSSFSSWGGPGSMVLKPEILAPGGSIYSVNGLNNAGGGHDQYEVMSGTSMASPQVAGMAAVMGQYIRDNDLCNKTGKSARQLINSLLMSTAHPVYDSNGAYWPVIRVGAGLGNVADATAAKSFIMMDEGSTMFPDSAKDGKVKAELGDDPDYTGEYEFSFMVYPLEDAKEFTLRTDIFTQWQPANGGYAMVQTKGTVLLGSTATYEVNGETYEDTYLLEADVNMDGKTDAADAQAILDHITGELAEDADFDETVADVDHDGDITTYDAKLLLDNAATPIVSITEPTKVTVHVKIDEGDKAFLLRYFSKGFYVEGYTYVDPVADEEGVLDVVHSIPIYGFCGSWTDPAMLDRTSVIDEIYGTGLLPYLANTQINYMSVKTPDGTEQIFVGNPYKPELEEAFPADRLAMNSEATINSFVFLPIRNVATYGVAVQDAEGAVIFANAVAGQKFAPYYYVNGGYWTNLNPTNYNVGKKLASMGLAEDDVATIGFYALPEYYGVLYAKDNDEVATTGGLDTTGFKAMLESGRVGTGAGFSYTVKIDDTAPEVKGAFMDLITGDITVKASDNNYIAYVGLTNKSGTETYLSVIPEQAGPGEEVEVPLVLEEGTKLPSEVLLQVGDYAGNLVAFKVALSSDSGEVEEDVYGGTMLGFVPEAADVAPGSGNRVWTIDPDKVTYNYSIDWSTYDYVFSGGKGLKLFSEMDYNVVAADYAEGYVFMAADDGYLYAGELDNLKDAARVGNYSETTSKIYDMAFNSTTHKLYALGLENKLYRINMITGELTLVAELVLPEVTGEANALAIDDNNNFYTANRGGSSAAKLFTFKLDDPDPEPEVDTAYSWGFEDEDEVDTWTYVDADGDGYGWKWNQDIADWFSGAPDWSSFAHESDGSIVSGSYINTVGALTPDNWAISPAFDLSEATDANVSFWANSIDSSYPDQVIVYAGTSPNPSSMTAISDVITGPDEYEEFTASLKSFAGEPTVYVAFRNYGTNDQYLIAIDDVAINVEATAPASLLTRDGRIVTVPVSNDTNEETTEDALIGWDFEADADGWYFKDADGDGYNWTRHVNTGSGNHAAHSGDAVICSESYSNDAEAALTPDNWAFTPPLDMTETTAATLSVWACAQDASWAAEKFALYAGTSKDSMVMLGEPHVMTNGVTDDKVAGSYYNFTEDLSDYLGEEVVYLAIRHYDCTDMFILNIDDVEILGEGSIALAEVEPEPEPEPEVNELEVVAEPVGTSYLGAYNYSYGGGLAWDHDKDILYFVSNYNNSVDYDHYLWIVDLDTGAAAKCNDVNGTSSGRVAGAVSGLLIVPKTIHNIHPVDEATAIEVDPNEIDIWVGQSMAVKASVYPWVVRDSDVTWTSADESIATVKDGVIKGVAEGETVVTATTVAEPNLSADVVVRVTPAPEAELRGVIWDESGKGQAAFFNTNKTSEWEAMAEVGQFTSGALVGDQVIGVIDDVIVGFDADTYETYNITTLPYYAFADAAPVHADLAELLGVPEAPIMGIMLGSYLVAYNGYGWTMSSYSDVFCCIALVEMNDETATYYLLDENGQLFEFVATVEGSSTTTLLGTVDLDLTGASDVDNQVWASMIYDEETECLFVSLYNGADEYAHLYAIDTNDLSRVVETGTFRADVWPVTSLYQYEPLTDLTLFVYDESVELYETQSKELNIRVKMGETNEYTLESADESIVSVDGNVITGLKEGETVVTVTTVDVNKDGEHLSAEIPVTVKPVKAVEAFVNAQVSDEHGTRFTKISLDGAVASRKGTEVPGDFLHGGRSGEIYAADIDGEINILDAETFEPYEDWNGFDLETYAEYGAGDLANYPVALLTNGKLDESHFLLTVPSAGYLVTPEYAGWNVSSVFPDIAAIAFAGLVAEPTEEPDKNTMGANYLYYILGAEGSLYYVLIDFEEQRITDYGIAFETGIKLADPTAVSMTFVATGKVNPDGSVNEEEYENAGLVIADNDTKALWYIDFMTEDEDDVVGYIGTVDALNVTGLTGVFDELADVTEYQDIEPWAPPEGVIAGWYFEDQSEVADWTFFEKDSDTRGWEISIGNYSAFEGDGLLLSRYNSNATVDNWAVTPAINLSEVDGAELDFAYAEYSDSWGDEHFEVYAGTSANPDEMTLIVEDTVASETWATMTVDLADYVGEEEVYIAFRHCNCVNTFYMFLDKVEVFEQKDTPEPGSGFQPVFYDFEDEDPLLNWTLVDRDEDGYNWDVAVDNPNYAAYDGNACLYSVSWSSSIGSLEPDNWAILPAVDLSETETAYLRFQAAGVGSSDSLKEIIGVYAGTSNEPDEMVQLGEDYKLNSGWNNEITVDLADYVGNDEVYVAIVHHNSDDRYDVRIDNVSIVSELESEETPEDLGGFAAVPMKAAKTMPEGIINIREALGLEMEKVELGHETQAADGALNAVRGEVLPIETRALTDETVAEEGQVSIDLSEDVAVTNGLYTVEYDADVLTFVEAASLLPYKSVSNTVNEVTEDETTAKVGVITFAFASVEEIPAETVLASLLFSYEGDEIDTTVTVYTIERNNDVEVAEDALEIPVKVEKPADPEDYLLADSVKDGDLMVIYNPLGGMAVSNADFSEAQPSYRAGVAVEPVEGVVTTADASIVWTAVAVEGGYQLLDAKGHKLSMADKGLELDKENDVWEIRRLEANKFAIVNVNAAPGSSGDPKALEWYTRYNEFSTHYLNTTDGQFIFELYIKDYEPAVHEHSYGEPVWSWNEDLTAATATFTCECGDEQVLDAVITEEVVTEAVPHVAGEKKLIATVTFNDAPYTDEKTVEIEALPCPCANFEDMPEYGTPEHEAIDWAVTNKFASGMNATSFGVGKTLTRAQTAVFLYAAAGKPEFDETNAPKTFTDVPAGKWYTKAVLWAAAEGIVSGYSDGTFKPNGNLTRGQIMVILYAQADKPSVEGLENPYSDVPAGKWFTDSALWAYHAGIERGADGKYVQSTPCTRDAFVLYLYRIMTGNCLLTDE